MIIFIVDKKIIGHIPSTDLTEERKTEILNENPNAVWIDKETIEAPDNTKTYDLYYRNGEIVYEETVKPEIEPQETQLDRIENAVNDIAKNNTSYAEMASAIAEGVNDIE